MFKSKSDHGLNDRSLSQRLYVCVCDCNGVCLD
jgi:hypothetical protein